MWQPWNVSLVGFSFVVGVEGSGNVSEEFSLNEISRLFFFFFFLLVFIGDSGVELSASLSKFSIFSFISFSL